MDKPKLIKSNWKKEFYILVVIVSVIVFIALIMNIMPNIKKFNQTTLNLLESLHIKYLENITNSNNKDKELNYLLPFEIEQDQDILKIKHKDTNFENKDLLISVTNDANGNGFKDLQSRDRFLSYFKIYSRIINNTINQNKTTTHSSYSIPDHNFDRFRFINIYLLIDINSDSTDTEMNSNKVISEFGKLDIGIPIYLKYLYCNYNDLHSKDFYNNIQDMNSKILFEELQDDNILSLIILNINKKNVKDSKDGALVEKKRKSKLEFTEVVELSKHIFTLDLYNELNTNIIQLMILISKAKYTNLVELIGGYNTNEFQLYLENVN